MLAALLMTTNLGQQQQQQQQLFECDCGWLASAGAFSVVGF
jgi:hypothetical protein